MGLRERKENAKRQLILQQGLRLFSERGFDQTTMERIAEACELSLSTVYRSFPGKDWIVSAAFADDVRTFTETFASQPKDMSVQEALTAVILKAFSITEEQRQRTELLRCILDQTPVARARLFDLLTEERGRLGALLAIRMGLPEDDLAVVLTARIALLVVETAADLSRGDRNGYSIAAALLRSIGSGHVVLPQLREESSSRRG